MQAGPLARPRPSRPSPGSSHASTAPARRQKRTFIFQYLTRPTMIGAIAPSSPHLAKRMVEWLDLEHAQAVVEIGPGTGAVTGLLLRRLRPQTRFFAIELNPAMAGVLREQYPGLDLTEDSAANIGAQCRRRGIGALDCVVSGLPWASFSPELQTEVLGAVTAALRPGGQFVTFAYQVGTLLPAGRRFSKRLPEFFSSVSRSRIVWRNLPPAFVYRCVK
jgi:phosphatidylethanolamine/phosphatidyl-N-methylethanolamine N-methyltransferase